MESKKEGKWEKGKWLQSLTSPTSFCLFTYLPLPSPSTTAIRVKALSSLVNDKKLRILTLFN